MHGRPDDRGPACSRLSQAAEAAAEETGGSLASWGIPHPLAPFACPKLSSTDWHLFRATCVHRGCMVSRYSFRRRRSRGERIVEDG
jgi:hypothetical protein